ERLQQSAHGLANSLLYLGTGKQPSWWQDLDQLKRPVCLIVGELDEKFIHMNKKMQKKLPQASFHLVKNAGHTVHIEQPETFSQINRELDEKNIHMNKIMQKKLPKANFHLVKNAGHTDHIEQPEAFSQIVEQHVL